MGNVADFYEVDDGYRAQHLYYKLDNFHYAIEVQIWAGRDIPFNTWMHAYTYKYLTSDVSLALRKCMMLE